MQSAHCQCHQLSAAIGTKLTFLMVISSGGSGRGQSNSSKFAGSGPSRSRITWSLAARVLPTVVMNNVT